MTISHVSHRWTFLFKVLIAIGGISLAAAKITYGQTSPNTEQQDPKKLQVESLLQQASDQLKSRQYEQSLALCDQAAIVDSTSAGPFAIRGRTKAAQAEFGKADLDEAFKQFDLALEQKSRDKESLHWRAEAFAGRSFAYYQQGKYLQAVDSAYLGTLEKFDHVDCHLNRARAYNARSDYDKAINSLNRVIAIDAKCSEAYSERGYAYGAKGNFDQTIADQKKALELNATNAIAYQRRAAAFISKKDMKSAIQDLEKALQLAPTLPEALCDRAMMYSMNRNPVQAMADLDSAIQANPTYRKAHILKGQARFAQEDIDGAIQCFDQAIALAPDAAAYYGRGLAYQSKKGFELSILDFTQTIQLDPKNLLAWKGRFKSLNKLNRTEEAEFDQVKIRELTPKAVEKQASESVKKPQSKPPQFLVKSKPVNPDLLSQAKASAAQIDRLVAANYKKFSIKPNPPASDAIFVRRVYLDIAGTIPTFQQTNHFLQSKEPDKREKLIDELLSSEGYASHSFNYWADIFRYKDQLSNDVRGESYRQWIKQSLAGNKPWNKLVYQMMTAEGLVWDNPATGYLQRDPGMPLDTMNNTIRIFLGTRIGCAQCHNHPFDRWTQKDFYQMAAFTFGTDTGTSGGDKRFWEKDPGERLRKDYEKIEQEEEDRRNNSYRFDRMMNVNMRIVSDHIEKKITLPKDYAYDDAKPEEAIEPKTLFGSPADIRQGESPRRAFARWLVSKDNQRFAKTIANRLWKQLFGIGQIDPVDDMMDSTVAENPELMDFLESEMKRLDFDMKEYLRIILNSETYQREASFHDVTSEEPFHFAGPMLRRMTAEQVWDSFLTLAVHPVGYREIPASITTNLLHVDLKQVSAKELLNAENKANEAEGKKQKVQSLYMYEGVLLARASELPSPVPANHFLRMFGQSDRELISASSTSGSVPQILVMFNGPISHMLLEKDSTIYTNIMRRTTVPNGIRTIFQTVLSRDPDQEELALATAEIKEKGMAGYGNVVWSLVNTREFLFVQ